MYCQNKGLSHTWEGRPKVHSQIKWLSHTWESRPKVHSQIKGLSTHAKMGFV